MKDLIYLLQGSSGTQSALMILAAIVQAINGILLAQMLSLQKPWKVFLTGALLCSYPAFLDYYVFASDHLIFCLGDTFAILGALCFLNCKTTALRITLPIALFVLSLASYQPKIALIGMLSLLVIPLSWLNKSALKEKGVLSLFAVLKEALQVLFISTFSVTIYWLSSKIIITHTVEARTYFNTNRESFNIIVNSYSRFLEYYTTHLGGIPPALSYIPLVIIFCGILYIFLSIYRVSPIGSLIFLLLGFFTEFHG